MVNIAFTITPMSAPGSAARLALFRLTGTHRCCPTWGFGLHPSLFGRSVCLMQRCTQGYQSCDATPQVPFSLHIHDTTVSFRIFSLSSVFTAVDFGIAAFHRDRLMSVIGIVRRLLRLLIILRPDALISLTGERISAFFGAFCALLLSWYLLTVRFRP